MRELKLLCHARHVCGFETETLSANIRGSKMKLSPDQSLAGILEPVFAIRTEDDLGIGDTEGVRQMIDWCHRHQLNILQTLPINEISDDNSPYNAISSLAIEPTTIAVSPGHLPDLSFKRFHEIATPESLAEVRNGAVNSNRNNDALAPHTESTGANDSRAGRPFTYKNLLRGARVRQLRLET